MEKFEFMRKKLDELYNALVSMEASIAHAKDLVNETRRMERRKDGDLRAW